MDNEGNGSFKRGYINIEDRRYQFRVVVRGREGKGEGQEHREKGDRRDGAPKARESACEDRFQGETIKAVRQEQKRPMEGGGRKCKYEERRNRLRRF